MSERLQKYEVASCCGPVKLGWYRPIVVDEATSESLHGVYVHLQCRALNTCENR